VQDNPRDTAERRQGSEGEPIAGVAIVDVWTFRTEPALGDVDLTGYKVEATDGHIGKIDEATYESGGSYLIVDTGPWIFGKKVMLPAGVVQRVDRDSETVVVDRSKDEIKNAPEYDEERVSGRHEDYRRELGDYYGGERGGRFKR